MADDVSLGELGRRMDRVEKDHDRLEGDFDRLRDGLDERIDSRIDRALVPRDARIGAIESSRRSSLGRTIAVISCVVGVLALLATMVGLAVTGGGS